MYISSDASPVIHSPVHVSYDLSSVIFSSMHISYDSSIIFRFPFQKSASGGNKSIIVLLLVFNRPPAAKFNNFPVFFKSLSPAAKINKNTARSEIVSWYLWSVL